MNITVYLGAKEGNDPALKRAVQELGQWIGQSGNALVYGGSKTGLMGEIAKSVLDAGGTGTGVETTLFMQDDLQYDGLTELIVTETITERKTEMIRRGDAFKMCIRDRGTTGVGGGVAIPHGKSNAVLVPALAAVTLREAIDYQALDGAPVRLLFLIAAPDGANDLHIQVLARLAQLLMEPLFCEELKLSLIHISWPAGPV